MATNTAKIMNTIRANASAEYQARVPEATLTNIQAVGNPILTYQSTQNEFLSALVNRIALVLVNNRIAKNPLAILKNGSIPLGKDIEEIFTNMATATTYDPTGENLLKRNIPDTKAAYHRLNRQDVYKVTINNDQLQTAFTSWDKLEELIGSIVNSLYSGDNFDEFLLMKKTFADAITGNKVVIKEIDAITNADTAKALVKEARTASGLFKFPSSKFNKYSDLTGATGKPVVTWTPVEDQIMLIKSEVLSAIDVDVLAAAFNLDKTTLMGMILEIDDFGDAESTVGMLIDKSFLKVYDNLQKMTEFYNSEGLYWNYWWHHWQTYSYSPFANAIAFNIKSTTPSN